MLGYIRRSLMGGLVIAGLFRATLWSCSAGGGGGKDSVGGVDGREDNPTDSAGDPLPDLCTGDDCVVTEWPDECDGGATVTILANQPGPRRLLAPRATPCRKARRSTAAA